MKSHCFPIFYPFDLCDSQGSAHLKGTRELTNRTRLRCAAATIAGASILIVVAQFFLLRGHREWLQRRSFVGWRRRSRRKRPTEIDVQVEILVEPLQYFARRWTRELCLLGGARGSLVVIRRGEAPFGGHFHRRRCSLFTL